MHATILCSIFFRGLKDVEGKFNKFILSEERKLPKIQAYVYTKICFSFRKHNQCLSRILMKHNFVDYIYQQNDCYLHNDYGN